MLQLFGMAGAKGRASVDARVDLVVCGLCGTVELSCFDFDLALDFGLGFGLSLVKETMAATDGMESVTGVDSVMPR